MIEFSILYSLFTCVTHTHSTHTLIFKISNNGSFISIFEKTIWTLWSINYRSECLFLALSVRWCPIDIPNKKNPIHSQFLVKLLAPKEYDDDDEKLS